MKTTSINLQDNITNAQDWLLDSGIQSKEGGFYAWQDIENKNYSYLYSEITGYAITTSLFLYEVTKKDIFLTRAKRSAQWIIVNAVHESGGILTRHYYNDKVLHYSFEGGNIYAFDCAMVAFGLLKLYKVTAKIQYCKTAKDIINFLIDNLLRRNGLFYPVYGTKNNKTYQDSGKWSMQTGSFHCKLALCLCELADIEKDAYYTSLAAKLIDSSLKAFYKDGRFITNISDKSSHLHPYCYTIEGIIYYCYKQNNKAYARIASDAFKWLLKFQEPDGGFPTHIFTKTKMVMHQRSDIQAQILRLYYLLGDKKHKSDIDIDKLVFRLLHFQNLQNGCRGAFLFGADEDGSYKMHGNAWCTMFALQALYLAANGIGKNTVMDYLV